VRYDPETGLIDSTGVPVIVTPEPITELSAAFDGEKIFLAFVQNDDIYGVFLNSYLQVIEGIAIGKEAEAPITLSPNPVKGNILRAVIRTPEVPLSFEIYDVSGRKIGRCRPNFLNGSQAILELPASIGPGVYFLAARTRGKTYRVMFLKM
ncbi:MAG TPA: T9SS type A sorting domain-containing protein, partial [candidate division WOR-3 bacterium]|nr:T9SS type A sorting domain-containing protein [candidate division WOR-3 bacterium]